MTDSTDSTDEADAADAAGGRIGSYLMRLAEHAPKLAPIEPEPR